MLKNRNRIQFQRRKLRLELLEPRLPLHNGEVHDVLSGLLPANGGDGSDGTIVIGTTANDKTGQSVSSAGDFNGDGIDDMLIGVPGSSASAGAAYVVFGSKTAFSATINPASLNGTNGFRITGSSGEQAGFSVSSAGDVNNDGRDDLLIGAPSSDPNGRTDAGSVYVVLGTASSSAWLALTSLNGSNGFRLNGAVAGDAAGTSVSKAGDVNQDGFDDLLIGASAADPNSKTGAGSVYVVFGKSSFASTANIDLASLTSTSGFQMDGAAAGDEFGTSVASAGDINQDGFSDVIVGAPGADPNTLSAAGSVYVVFGAASLSATIDLSTLNGTNGFRLDGVAADDRAGQAVAGDGDANNDGLVDILIGSPRAKVDGVSIGAAYVIYGKSTGYASSLALSSLNGVNGFKISGDYESDPLLNSFIINTTNKLSGGVAGQNASYVTLTAPVNFTSVIVDDTSVYAKTSGIPYQLIGPFPGNPGSVKDQAKTVKIPRNPTENTGTKTATSTGAIGIWIDGMAIYNWSDAQSYQNAGVWQQNAVYFEGGGLDSNGGHPPPTGDYHTHAVNIGLMRDLGDNGSSHSPLLGWSYDGFPIYGPWGYANADGTGGIAKQSSSWKTRNITVRTHLADGTDVADGPTVGTTPLGAYVQDYEYVPGLGTLDRYNGRFSVTPEYPNRIYHYVVTIGSSSNEISIANSVFPYVIGVQYYGNVETANIMTGGGPGGSPGGGPGGGGPPPTPTVITPGTADISVAFANDFNGDGIDEILIGDPDAYSSTANVAGSVSVVYGKSSFASDVSLRSLSSSDGQVLRGVANKDKTGRSVGAADLNGDGGADLLIGASDAGTLGAVFTVFGETPASVLVTHSGGSTIVNESGATDTLSVVLSNQPTSTVTIAVSSSNTSEVTVNTNTLTFTTSNWNIAQVITLTGVADNVVDTDKNVTVTLDPSSTDARYNALSTIQTIVTNQNVGTNSVTPAKIVKPDLVVGTHVIPANDVRTAIIFRSISASSVSVTPGSAPATVDAIAIYDASLASINQTSGGATIATIGAGGIYAIVFSPSTSERSYSVSTPGGASTLSLTATNILLPTDTNGDGYTQPIDVLVVINYLGRTGVVEGLEFPNTDFLLDVNRDGSIAPIDVLVVINQLRRENPSQGNQGEGEFAQDRAISLATPLIGSSNSNSESVDVVLRRLVEVDQWIQSPIDAPQTPGGSRTSLELLHPDTVDCALAMVYPSDLSSDQSDDSTGGLGKSFIKGFSLLSRSERRL